MPKENPARFALRATAPRAIRVRRGVLIGASVLIIAVILGSVTLALRVPRPVATAQAQDAQPGDPAASKEALASAPNSYAQAPVLGPPLTGMAMITGKPAHPIGDPGSDQPSAEGMDSGGTPSSADQKGVDIRRAPLLVSLAANAAPAPPVAEPASTLPSSAIASVPAGMASDAQTASPDPNGQGRKAALVHTSATGSTTNPHVLTPPVTRWVVSAGSIVAASLLTGLDSDLPGEVTAQVTENVYDTPTGQTLLIPQGSRLIGTNDNGVSYGQKRALIVWQRLILPDGSSIVLDNWPAADKAGFTGLSDRVDAHSWQLIKGVALSTLLGIGSELSYGSSDSDLARALRQSVETGTNRAGQQLVSKSLDIQPTIRVRPGWPVRVVVHQDLALQPWTG